MAYGHSANDNNLGFGIQEIELFRKDIDYDMLFYKTHILKEDKANDDTPQKLSLNKKTSGKKLIEIWEEGGHVKALYLEDLDAYRLYFHNFQNYGYTKLKKLLGNFFTVYEFENFYVRVTFRDENDLRIAYKKLKKNKDYRVWVDLDIEEYKKRKENYVKQNNRNSIIKNRNIIQQWLNNEEVVCETSQPNSFPVEIYNYKHLKYHGLMELFSKYGKFNSICHSENECVVVKFCDEEGARNCYKDLRMDTHYNVKLLFFLKALNNHKKLVKDVLPCDEEACINRLLAAEEKIKFATPNESLIRNPCSNRERAKCSKGKKIQEKRDDFKAVYFTQNRGNYNVNLEGTPLYNEYLKPPYSYKVWYNKKHCLPPPTPDSPTSNDEKDINYEYYLEGLKDNSENFSNMHSSFQGLNMKGTSSSSDLSDVPTARYSRTQNQHNRQ